MSQKKNDSRLTLAFLLSLCLHFVLILALDINEFEPEPPSPFAITLQTFEARAERAEPKIQKPIPLPAKDPLPKKESPKPEEKVPLERNEVIQKDVRPKLSTEIRREQRRYLQTLRLRIARNKNYPREARKKGWEGVSQVQFTVDQNGNLLKAEIVQSSSFPVLDQAAIQAIRESAPFERFPAKLFPKIATFNLPVLFELH